MTLSEPKNWKVRSKSDSRTIYEIEDGVEVVVNGDETRHALARLIVAELPEISARATRLLVSFMRDTGEFDLCSIEVFGAQIEGGGDFLLDYCFVADRDPHEYGYAYFHVVFSHHPPPQPPFWPYKFTVGFH